ncbi:MAG: DUF1573 domain-containing protein [Tannerella sp.]|jgi:hypothetical protein|nr:DUF1573 domain-containing protein [Tannerella sp.]
MKRIFFVFAFITLTASIASAQQKNAVIEVIDSAVYDFGQIKESAGPVTHIFKVKNSGEVALVITNATASCGCTTPVWTKEPIAPGKTGEISVTYDPTNRPGPFTKPITVYSNGKTGTYVLNIRGVVVKQ